MKNIHSYEVIYRKDFVAFKNRKDLITSNSGKLDKVFGEANGDSY